MLHYTTLRIQSRFSSVLRFSILSKFSRYAFVVILGLIVSTKSTVASASVSEQAITFKKIALTGDPAANVDNDTIFQRLTSPALNNSGQLAFLAWLTSADSNEDVKQGIFLNVGNVANQIVSTGDIVQFAQGEVKIQDIYAPVLNDLGQTAFAANFTYLPKERRLHRGVFTVSNDTIQFLARPDFQLFRGITNLPPAFNDAGQVLFRASITGGIRADGLATMIGDEFRAVFIPGANVPGTQLKSLGTFSDPRLNNAGQTVFSVGLTDPEVDRANDEGIFFESDARLSLVARTGDAAPGTELGTTYSNFVSDPVLNDSGQIAFLADLSRTSAYSPLDTAIFVGTSDNVNLVARTGDAVGAISQHVRFSRILSPTINNGGDIAFSGVLQGSGIDISNNNGLFIKSEGNLRLVAQKGEAVPDTELDVRFDWPSLPLLNDLGQVAFGAFLTGRDVDNTNNVGIFATDRAGNLRQIARKGDLFDVDPDPAVTDNRRIRFVRFPRDSQGSDGRPRSYNNSGQLALRLDFTDGTQGIFVALIGIPEPSTLILLGVGVVLHLGSHQKRVS
ncbi:MAG: hypothetical protein GXP24_09295 [Planctomycetes bacterium]|nr:hypothetical protein [Planctomycetota bacterium]